MSCGENLLITNPVFVFSRLIQRSPLKPTVFCVYRSRIRSGGAGRIASVLLRTRKLLKFWCNPKQRAFRDNSISQSYKSVIKVMKRSHTGYIRNWIEFYLSPNLKWLCNLMYKKLRQESSPFDKFSLLLIFLVAIYGLVVNSYGVLLSKNVWYCRTYSIKDMMTPIHNVPSRGPSNGRCEGCNPSTRRPSMAREKNSAINRCLRMPFL